MAPVINEVDKARRALAKTRHRWRDGKGVVHELRFIFRRNVMSLDETGAMWMPACGYPYNSRKRAHDDTPVTCVACLTTLEWDYRCMHCGHYGFEHARGECSGCIEALNAGWSKPAFDAHVYEPDYRYRLEDHV